MQTEDYSKLLFRRVEKKYLLTNEQASDFIILAADRLKCGDYGDYSIYNLYLDGDNFELINLSLQKPIFKQKVRLRAYSLPTLDGQVFWEIKKKYDGVVFKRRVKVCYGDFFKYCVDGNAPSYLKGNNTFNEIDFLHKHYNLQPAAFLAYDRQEYIGCEDKNLRITFDTNLRARFSDVDFLSGDGGKQLVSSDVRLCEIKLLGAMPVWLCEIIDKLKIYPTTFSKYGNAYIDEFKNKGVKYAV